jgi:serine/threonine protein phosphatase 1
MMARLWANFSGRSERPEPTPLRKKLFFNERPQTIYAVGDVHGCYDLLKSLQEKIRTDASKQEGTKWLVMLGDYVDRGPNSASVLDDLITNNESGIALYYLAGNHEETMQDFLLNPHPQHRWLGFGGIETLQSYGIYEVPTNRHRLKAVIDSHVPPEHLSFLQALPSLISVPGLCFAHAGIENGIPLEQQTDKHLLWTRPQEQKQPATINSFLTVHGHTPVKSVALMENRLNVDTGAFMSGRLSAVKISRDGDISVMHAD